MQEHNPSGAEVIRRRTWLISGHLQKARERATLLPLSHYGSLPVPPFDHSQLEARAPGSPVIQLVQPPQRQMVMKKGKDHVTGKWTMSMKLMVARVRWILVLAHSLASPSKCSPVPT